MTGEAVAHCCAPQVADYREIFDRIDCDGSGAVDTQELGTLVRGLGC
jgi:Ca2+-binding EF-hand superfamily protein